MLSVEKRVLTIGVKKKNNEAFIDEISIEFEESEFEELKKTFDILSGKVAFISITSIKIQSEVIDYSIKSNSTSTGRIELNTLLSY